MSEKMGDGEKMGDEGENENEMDEFMRAALKKRGFREVGAREVGSGGSGATGAAFEDAFDVFEVFDPSEITQSKDESPLSSAMRLLSSLKVGDVVRVANTKWEVRNPRDVGSVTVYVKKAGTAGTKHYQMSPANESGEMGVFPVGGSGQRIGPDVVVGPYQKIN